MKIGMKAQIEMIGLVFVVVIIVMGIVLYAKFSSTAQNHAVKQEQGSSSFVTALGQTTTPCGVPVERLAASCIENDGQCQDACSQLQEVFNTITSNTLSKQGVKYNLSLEGKGVQSVDNCNSADPKVLTSPGGMIPVVLSNNGRGRITLYICR